MAFMSISAGWAVTTFCIRSSAGSDAGDIREANMVKIFAYVMVALALLVVIMGPMMIAGIESRKEEKENVEQN